jgi:RES domain-containing protein
MTNLDPAVIPRLPTQSFLGECFRQQAPKYDPLSGEGARRQGGRFNPPRSFPVLYLCTTRACAVAELRRAGGRLAIGLEGLLPRQLYRYEVNLVRVVDLTDEATLTALGYSLSDMISEDLSLPRAIGESAHSFGIQAVLCRSARTQDDVLAVFLKNVGLSTLSASLGETWETVEDLQD